MIFNLDSMSLTINQSTITSTISLLFLFQYRTTVVRLLTDQTVLVDQLIPLLILRQVTPLVLIVLKTQIKQILTLDKLITKQTIIRDKASKTQELILMGIVLLVRLIKITPIIHRVIQMIVMDSASNHHPQV